MSRFALATANTSGAAQFMQNFLTYLADHACQVLITLSPEQAAVIMSSFWAAGSLLLQYLSYRREKKKR